MLQTHIYFDDPLKILAICFCENSNGSGNQSGIMCEGNNEFYRKAQCQANQWCTGPTDGSSNVISYMKLCEDGITMREIIISEFLVLFEPCPRNQIIFP